jgi:hypothetical protein
MDREPIQFLAVITGPFCIQFQHSAAELMPDAAASSSSFLIADGQPPLIFPERKTVLEMATEVGSYIRNGNSTTCNLLHSPTNIPHSFCCCWWRAVGPLCCFCLASFFSVIHFHRSSTVQPICAFVSTPRTTTAAAECRRCWHAGSYAFFLFSVR